MTIQDDFQDAGDVYAAYLTDQHEADRLAALTLEAKKADNARAFAAAIGLQFTQPNTDPEGI